MRGLDTEESARRDEQIFLSKYDMFCHVWSVIFVLCSDLGRRKRIWQPQWRK